MWITMLKSPTIERIQNMNITVEALKDRKVQLTKEIENLNALLKAKESELREIGCKIDFILNRERCHLCDAYVVNTKHNIVITECDSVSKSVKIMRYKLCNKCYEGLMIN